MVMGRLVQDTELLVIGAGPGGYAAAFRAADLGMDVTMIDTDPRPGGTCLFRGCIPSKTLLAVTELMHDAARGPDMGITFGEPSLDMAALRGWKESVIEKLAGGLVKLSSQRGVQLIQGRACFEGSNAVSVQGSDIAGFRFKHAILATGSRPLKLALTDAVPPEMILDSTGALALEQIPRRLLVVGGGYVGLELGSVYAGLGSEVTLVDASRDLARGADRDLARPLIRRIKEGFAAVHLGSEILSLREVDGAVEVELRTPEGDITVHADRILVAIGRRANSDDLGLEKTGVKLDARGFVLVDEHQRSSDPAILAVGDVVGGAMLAHKAMREGRVAAEVAAGQDSAFDVVAIPSVVYTDPQLAWCGLTEETAQARGMPVQVSRFPWSASGRAMTIGATEGMTKVLFDPETQRVLGVGIVGRGAGEMIAEGVLAVEMGVLAQDLALTMHPHPTLSETEEEAAELFLGSPIHLAPMKR